MKPDIFRQTFGENLQFARVGADLSLNDLAKQTGFPPDYIIQIEHGDLNVPIGTLDVLASRLGSDVARMLRRQPA